MKNYVIFLKNGEILPATEIVLGRTTKVISNQTQLDIDDSNIENIHEIEPKDTFSSLAQANPHGSAALANLLCGLLEIEKTAARFRNSGLANTEDNALPIAIFGSSTLALTILPQRVSHDVDACGTRNFVKYWQDAEKDKTHHGAVPQICYWELLRYLGDWMERSGQLLGTKGIEFLLVHPLDTVTQKLLRVSETVFETKDKRDITATLEILKPSKKTLIGLLTENPARYRFPETHPLKKPSERNLKWLLKQFLPETTIAILQKEADRKELECLSSAGLAPTPGIKKPTPKKIEDLLKQIK